MACIPLEQGVRNASPNRSIKLTIASFLMTFGHKNGLRPQTERPESALIYKRVVSLTQPGMIDRIARKERPRSVGKLF